MVLQSLQKFIEVYEDLGPTTDGFVALMQRRKAELMGPYKWVVVKERVTREHANSMFNFKESLKWKALKVQYFKHPELAHFLYDWFPWNNEVPNYFSRFFYAEFFLGMKPDYTDIHSEFYGVGKGRICNRKGALRDPSTLRPPPLISRSLRLVTYKSEMEPTSQVRTTARHNVAEGLTSAFVGVDVGLSREKAHATIRQNFVYKIDDELDCMDIEDLKAYAKLCHNIASDRISNDTSSIGEICVLSIHYCFYSL